MLITLLLIAAFRPSSSIPVDGGSDLPENLSERLQERLVLPDTTRSRQDIIWSCLATIFACTWVAVHPNIPGPRESQWRRFRRRASTMFYAVIAPELVTLWAMRQRYAAGRIKREFNRKHFGNVALLESSWDKLTRDIKNWFRSPEDDEAPMWTLSHGFFIQMGGLLFIQDGRAAFVITFKQLQTLIDKGTIDFPTITEEDILDKSKGDFLTKLLVVTQTTWFIAQCIVRWAAKLPVTELEVVTLAFAILNIITYVLWWQKPQNVQAAILIPKKSGAPPLEIPEPEEHESWLHRQIRQGGQGETGWLPWMILVSLLIPVKFLSGLFIPLGEMATDDQVPAGSTSVPTFYADHDITDELAVIFPSLGMSVIFGALHIIPWNSHFPTDTERLLWRVCSAVIAIEPLPGAIGFGLYWLTDGHPVGAVIKAVMDAMAMSLGSLAFIGLPLYVLARLTLLLLAFSTLRSLDDAALTDVAWSSFMPHI